VEAEQAIKTRRPDLMILDVMMPRKDGYQLCKELKQNSATKGIPIIMLTAVGDAVPTTTYTHREGMSMEAEDYIEKPVDTKKLLESVNGFFA
jgi:DNA-binding response OmpR family regulator